MTLPTLPTPPPGWYPAGPGMLRYWDGAAWTSHHAPIPAPASRPTVAPTTHVIHLGLSVLTCGLWVPVWLLIALVDARGRGAPPLSRGSWVAVGVLAALVVAYLIAATH